MTLSKQLLDEIADLKSDQPADDEKRRAPRVGLRVPIDVYLPSGTARSRAVNVTVRDISATGISLVHRDAMARGSIFALKLPRRDGSPVALCCTVRHCRKVADRVYNIGAEFTRFVAA